MLAGIERGLPAFAGLPISLVWGMRDWCFRPDSLDRFMKVWPRAEVHCLENVGHWVVEDAPDESLAVIEQFLARQYESNESASTVALQPQDTTGQSE
jgi:haloalkane dehalogenase